MALPRFPPRSLWPHLLLVVTFGAAGFVAVHAHATRKAQLATLHEAVEDYATFASWSYEQHARRELEDAFWQFLRPVNHGDAVHTSDAVPEAADLVHYLPFDSAGCYCHVPAYVPDGVFALTLGSDSLDVAVNHHAGPSRGIRVESGAETPLPPGVVDDPAPRRYGPEERRRIARTLAEHARGPYRAAWRLAIVPRPAAGGTGLVGYTVMPTEWGDTLVYGIELPPREVSRLFGRVLDERELLPETFVRHRPNREILHAAVFAPGQAPLFSSGPVPETRMFVRGSFPEKLGGLSVRTAIGTDVAEDLVIGGVPESRLPLMLGILAVAAALAVVSVGQIRREGELARQRTDFVSAVSHELRTPLAQIRLYLETLRLGRFRTEARREDALERIDRETARLGHLVQSILHFVRDEHGASPPEATLLPLASELRDAVDAFEPLAAARDVSLEVRADEGARVRADRRELRQILINLLDNAVKYGPAGQTVTVAARCADGRAVIAVEDEGPGVAEGHRERIWEAFERGDGADERSVGGSGIGLSVVRKIARAHGGAVRVETAPGGGARFVVELPGDPGSGAAASSGTGEPATTTEPTPG